MKPNKKKILLVDDDDGMRKEFSEYLKDYGYEVIEARTGKQALQLIFDEPHAFGLLILDVFMREDESAGKDSEQGFVIADALEKNGINVPIKFITQHREMVNVHDFERFSNYKDYFFKPIKLALLLNNARQWIG